MSIRPLTPQSPERVEWEQRVTHLLEVRGEITTSDAQGWLAMESDLVDQEFADGNTPEQCVEDLLNPEPSSAAMQAAERRVGA